eukprot:2196041-Prymnesium_polylepis.2
MGYGDMADGRAGPNTQGPPCARRRGASGVGCSHPLTPRLDPACSLGTPRNSQQTVDAQCRSHKQPQHTHIVAAARWSLLPSSLQDCEPHPQTCAA